MIRSILYIFRITYSTKTGGGGGGAQYCMMISREVHALGANPPPFPPHTIMYGVPLPGTCSSVGKCRSLESYPWQLIFFEMTVLGKL